MSKKIHGDLLGGPQAQSCYSLMRLRKNNGGQMKHILDAFQLQVKETVSTPGHGPAAHNTEEYSPERGRNQCLLASLACRGKGQDDGLEV